MDDLIVIILTLIVAAAGALGQLKKKKQAASPVENEGEPAQPESLWDLFQEDAGQQPRVEKLEDKEYDYEQYEEKVSPKVEVKTEKPNYQFTAHNEGKSIVKDKLPMKVKRLKSKSGIKRDFSLRKAVIYSEILNRKYS